VTRDPLDGVLGAVIAGRREMARHVRKLEDTGLATYAGRDPATVGLAAVVLAGIASVATLAGAVIKVTCAASQSLTPSSPFCRIGDFLLAFGLLLFAAAAVLGVIALILQTAASASSG
jgi:hypothetical protein